MTILAVTFSETLKTNQQVWECGSRPKEAKTYRTFIMIFPSLWLKATSIKLQQEVSGLISVFQLLLSVY